MANQLNNAPPPLPVGVQNLAYPQPVSNPYMQQNPQPAYVQQSRIGYPPSYNYNINAPTYYNAPSIYQGPPPQQNPVYVINMGGNSALSAISAIKVHPVSIGKDVDVQLLLGVFVY